MHTHTTTKQLLSQQLPTTVEFVDIAGLVRGASKGEGLGNKFLANIRETDAICQVRLFYRFRASQSSSSIEWGWLQ